MRRRTIVKIDEEKCDGCGKCVISCAEGAIAVINGKARLISDIYCDGLGACLGTCPKDAITLEERNAEEYEEIKTHEHLKNLEEKKKTFQPQVQMCSCPSASPKALSRNATIHSDNNRTEIPSALCNWPVKLKLAATNADYLQNCDLLIAADCVPFSCGGFHAKYLNGKILLAGCPKFDDSTLYIKKLADIFKLAKPESLTVLYMEVPCCSSILAIIDKAIEESGTDLRYEKIRIALDGEEIK